MGASGGCANCSGACNECGMMKPMTEFRPVGKSNSPHTKCDACHTKKRTLCTPAARVPQPAAAKVVASPPPPSTLEIILGPKAKEFASCRIRKTNETPPSISLIDVIAAVKGVSTDTARTDLSRVMMTNPHLKNRLQHHQFAGQRQRATPVANETDCKEILLAILANARMTQAKKQKLMSVWGVSIAIFPRCYIEEETLEPVIAIFSHLNPIKQFVCGPYRIDLYFPHQKVAVECDEHNHACYCNDKQRQAWLTQVLGCTFVRYNPHAQDFAIYSLIERLVLILTIPRP